MMKPLALIAVCALALLGNATQDVTKDLLESANRLFKEGKFAEAQALYSKVQGKDPTDVEAPLRLGMIALFENKPSAAEMWLTKAGQMKPEDKDAMKSLAQVHYRRDDFEKAAPLYRATGVEPRANLLESFRAQVPYQIESNSDIAHVSFLHTDPLPLIEVKVNGTETVKFIIDTGAAEVYIDTELAKKVNAPQFGSTTGTFAGGLKAQTSHGRIDSLQLGDFVIHNVPVRISNTQQFAAVARGKRVDGVLGTLMLSHFLSTLDYPGGKLTLRRPTKELLKEFEKQAKDDGAIVMPFWWAGNHVLVTWGQVNKSKPMLFFVDTGLAGAAFTCPESTLKEAAVPVPAAKGLEGIGGGGMVKLAPFTIEELTLGTVTQQKIPAFFGPFPENLETSQGFRIGGIISHQFFRPYALTFDFTGMRLFLTKSKA
jgi:Aspartyl protease